MMTRTLFIYLALTISPLFGFTKVPGTIAVGSYSVSLECDERWSVQVFEPKGVVVFSCDDGGVGFQLAVYRMPLPDAVAQVEPAELANRLVRDDGFKFKQSMFKKPARLAHAPQVVPYAAGTAYVYAEDMPAFRDLQPHYARAALLLPADYRTRRICYLVVGHQAGERGVRQLQEEPFTTLLRGLREIETGQATAVTPATVPSPAAQ